MDLQKLTVKFFTVPPDSVPLTEFIEIFHGWIQATDGIYHDVADYSHMESGPGIVLVAQQANLHILIGAFPQVERYRRIVRVFALGWGLLPAPECLSGGRSASGGAPSSQPRCAPV